MSDFADYSSTVTSGLESVGCAIYSCICGRESEEFSKILQDFPDVLQQIKELQKFLENILDNKKFAHDHAFDSSLATKVSRHFERIILPLREKMPELDAHLQALEKMEREPRPPKLRVNPALLGRPFDTASLFFMERNHPTAQQVTGPDVSSSSSLVAPSSLSSAAQPVVDHLSAVTGPSFLALALPASTFSGGWGGSLSSHRSTVSPSLAHTSENNDGVEQHGDSNGGTNPPGGAILPLLF